MSDSKIIDLNLYRDGGSFAFTFEKAEYECMTGLFILESKGTVVVDTVLVKKIIDAFSVQLDSDDEFNKLMRGRVNELARYLMTLEKIHSELVK